MYIDPARTLATPTSPATRPRAGRFVAPPRPSESRTAVTDRRVTAFIERSEAAADLARSRARLVTSTRALADIPDRSHRRAVRDARTAAERDLIGAEADFKRAALRWALVTDGIPEQAQVPQPRRADASEYVTILAR